MTRCRPLFRTLGRLSQQQERRLLSQRCLASSRQFSTVTRENVETKLHARFVSTPSDQRVEAVPLTLVDVQMRHEQLPFAYFFKETLEYKELVFSLEQVLRYYPVFAGTIDLALGHIECKPGDSIPLSYNKSDKSLAYWMERQHNGHTHVGGGGHPELTPLFDALYEPNTRHDNSRLENLVSIKVTHCKGGGTVIGVNINHALGDAASCIRFVQCWGRAMSQQTPRGASNDRASATCSGMFTLELSDLMGFQSQHTEPVSDWLKSLIPLQLAITSVEKATNYMRNASDVATQQSLYAMTLAIQGASGFGFAIPMAIDSRPRFDPPFLNEAAAYFKVAAISTRDQWLRIQRLFSLNGGEEACGKQTKIQGVDHEYVSLTFTNEELKAMKAFGMECCRTECNDTNSPSFVSTNDMVTACGWLLKRQLSGRPDWNMSMVVNLRGRAGVQDFSNNSSGVLGNAITNVIASMPPCDCNDNNTIQPQRVAKGAISIRNALTSGLLNMADQITLSRNGDPVPSLPSTNSFATTSWGQLPLWDISFSPQSRLEGFHGHPSFPLPGGRTFSSVICPNQNGACTYNLLLPSDEAQRAKYLHNEMCTSFVDWYKTFSKSPHRATN